MKWHREEIFVLCIFLFALFVRIRFAMPALMGTQGFIVSDEREYYSLAISLLQTGRLDGNGTVAYRMPFYPMVLAANYALLGRAPEAATPFNVILSALTCVGVYLLGKAWFSARVGLLAACISSLDVSLIVYSRVLLTETLFVFLVLCGLLALERLRQTQRWQWAMIAGLLAGLATLTRVNFALFVPCAVGWLVLDARSKRRVMFRNAIIVVLLVGATWTAWIVRNYAELGAFVPLTTQGGAAYAGVYNDIAANPAQGYEYGAWVEIIPHPPESPGKEWNEVALDQWQKETAATWIRIHPAQAVVVALMQISHLWLPHLEFEYFLVPFLLFAGAIGFGRALRQGNRSVILFAILALVLTIMAVTAIAVPRFKLPVHPGLTVLAAFAILTSWEKIILKWRRV